MTPGNRLGSPSRTRHRGVVVALAAATALAVAACGSSSSTKSATTPSGGGAATSAPAGGAPASSAAGSGSGSGSSTDNGGATAPGVTATTISLGTHQPLTGPAAPGYSKISAAASAYFKFVNAAGGVNGRMINLKVDDDGYNPAMTATDVRQLVLQDKVFAIFAGLGTPTHTAVLDFLKSNKIPDLMVSSGSRSWDQPSKYPDTFGWQTDYTIEGKVLGDYVTKNFAGKKVCTFGQNDDFGTDGVQGLQVTYKGALGSKQTYDPTNTNVAPQVGALQAAGCQVVVSFTVPGFTALELGTAAKIGFKAQYVVSNVGSDVTTLTGFLMANTKPLLEGVVSDSYLPLTTDDSNSWTTLFKKVDAMYDGNAPYDGNVEYGMGEAYTLVQALQAAGPKLTRQGLIDAMNKGGFTGPGLTPLRYSSSDHSGYSGVQVAVIKNGVPTFTGPIYTTDDGDGPLTAYTTAQPTAPANGIPSS